MSKARAALIDEDKPLTPQQQRFVEEYLVCLNAAEAARRASYSAKETTRGKKPKRGGGRRTNAENTGYILLHKPNIAKAIKIAIAERAARVSLKADQVVEELAVIAKSSLNDYVVTDEGRVELAPGVHPSAIRAVAGIKFKRRTMTHKDGSTVVEVDADLRLWSKPEGLRMSGQHLGMFSEKVVFTGPNDGPIEVNVTDVRNRIAKRIGGIAGRIAQVTGAAASGNGTNGHRA